MFNIRTYQGDGLAVPRCQRFSRPRWAQGLHKPDHFRRRTVQFKIDTATNV